MSPEDIERIIKMLTEKFGPIADTAFRLALRQTYTWAFMDLVSGAVLILAAVFGINFFLKTNDENTWDEMLSFMWWLGVFLAVAIGMACLLAGINRLINPELTGLMDLMNMLK